MRYAIYTISTGAIVPSDPQAKIIYDHIYDILNVYSKSIRQPCPHGARTNMPLTLFLFKWSCGAAAMQADRDGLDFKLAIVGKTPADIEEILARIRPNRNHFEVDLSPRDYFADNSINLYKPIERKHQRRDH